MKDSNLKEEFVVLLQCTIFHTRLVGVAVPWILLIGAIVAVARCKLSSTMYGIGTTSFVTLSLSEK